MLMQFIFIFYDNIWFVLLSYFLHLYTLHKVLSNVNNDLFCRADLAHLHQFLMGKHLLSLLCCESLCYLGGVYSFFFIFFCSLALISTYFFIYIIKGIIKLILQTLQWSPKHGMFLFFLSITYNIVYLCACVVCVCLFVFMCMCIVCACTKAGGGFQLLYTIDF